MQLDEDAYTVKLNSVMNKPRIITSEEASELFKDQIIGRVLSQIIFAGPGTGKTFTIRKTLLSLQRCKVPPQKILVLAFTRNNIIKMIEDISKQNSKSMEPIDLGYCSRIKTFHSFAKNLIQTSIIDQADKITILKQICKQNEHLRPRGQDDSRLLAKIMRDVDYIIDNDLDADIYYEQKKDKKRQGLSDLQTFIHRVGSLFLKALQEKFKQKPKSTTFGYSIKKAKDVIRLNQSKLLSQIQYIIIDQFQDFNKLQLNILREINKIKPRSFLFLGDPDQNIYQFRSAFQSNIDQFIQDLKPQSLIIKQTRRLSKPLLKLANQFIAINDKNREKRKGFLKDFKIQANHNKSEDKPQIKIFQKEIDQLVHTVQKIKFHMKQKQNNIQFKDIVILTRGKVNNIFLKKLKILLNEENIPYQQKFDRDLIDRKPIKKIFDTLRYFYYVKKNDNKRIQRYTGYVFIDLFKKKYSGEQLKKFVQHKKICQELSPYDLFGKRPIEQARTFGNAFFHYWTELQRMMEDQKTLPSKICEFIWLECYAKFAGLQSTSELQTFFDICKEYDEKPFQGTQSRLWYFIRELTEQANAKFSLKDVYDGKASIQVSNKVKLYTLHQAKGLQFKLVILPCMSGNFIEIDQEEGNINKNKNFFQREDLIDIKKYSEAQINLYYTGITRSSRFLYITRSRWNKCNGGNEEKNQFTYLKDILLKQQGLKQKDLIVPANLSEQILKKDKQFQLLDKQSDTKAKNQSQKKSKRRKDFSLKSLYQQLIHQGLGRNIAEQERMGRRPFEDKPRKKINRNRNESKSKSTPKNMKSQFKKVQMIDQADQKRQRIPQQKKMKLEIESSSPPKIKKQQSESVQKPKPKSKSKQKPTPLKKQAKNVTGPLDNFVFFLNRQEGKKKDNK